MNKSCIYSESDLYYQLATLNFKTMSKLLTCFFIRL